MSFADFGTSKFYTKKNFRFTAVAHLVMYFDRSFSYVYDIFTVLFNIDMETKIDKKFVETRRKKFMRCGI